jgi:DNA-binding MurR/RpiR family transcriptional regulator
MASEREDEAAMSSVPSLIHERLEDLTLSETRVARAILGSYPMLALRSSAVIAKESGTSPATVVRFAVKLGFGGLPDLHHAVRTELDKASASPFALFEAPRTGSKMTATESVMSLIGDALQRLTHEQVSTAATLMLGARRVWVLGGRFSFGLAHNLYAHLNLLRARVRLLAAWPAPVPDQVAHLGRDELVVVFDFRRYDPTAEFVASHFSANRCKVILVTDPYLSPAAQHADLTVIVPIEGHGLVDTYAPGQAVVDVIVSALIAEDESLLTRQTVEVERVRERSDRILHDRARRSDHIFP